MKTVALITGASSGIGREFARIHARAGGDLVLVARRLDKLQELEKELSDTYDTKVMLITKDLTQANACQEIYDELKKFGVKPEYLINNAGFGGLGKFTERKWEDESSMIALNITALTQLCHLFLPDMVSRNSGKILNVSSTASFLPGPLQAVYYASKAYVTSFSNAVDEELHDTSITVTTLLPGATATEFGAVSGMDKTSFFSKTASAEDVALDGYKANDGMKTQHNLRTYFCPKNPNETSSIFSKEDGVEDGEERSGGGVVGKYRKFSRVKE